MANAWDDFWSQEPFSFITKQKPLGNAGPSIKEIGKNVGDFFTNSGLGRVDYDFKDGSGQFRYTPGHRPQQAANPDRLPGLGRDNTLGALRGQYNSKTPGTQGVPPSLMRPAEKDPMDKLLERRAQLEAMLDEDYTGDPEVDALIEEAYSSALSNVSRARDSANQNFQTSDANIERLSAGHVREIETKDRDAVNRIGSEYQQNLQGTYDSAKGNLTAQRDQELQAREAMLQRLGIQEAGIGEAGQGESEALTRLEETQAGAMKQAQGYQQADLIRNTEQAQSQASAGVERRSDLNKQLQGILGNLDEAETELGSSRAQAKLQAFQSGRNDYNQRLGAISDQIAGIDDRIDERTDADRDYQLELQKMAQEGQSQGGVFDVVNNSFRTRGFAPEPYEQAYAQVASSRDYNSQVNGDKTLWLVREMKRKNPALNEDQIMRYVMGINNYGTDKLGTS